MTDYRIIPCEYCGSEGRILRGHPNDPYPRDCGPCPVCEGTGSEVIEVEPLTMDEALEADGEKLRQLTGEDHGPW